MFVLLSLVFGGRRSRENLENDEEKHQHCQLHADTYDLLTDAHERYLGQASIQGLNTCLKTTIEKENNKILTSLHTDSDSISSSTREDHKDTIERLWYNKYNQLHNLSMAIAAEFLQYELQNTKYQANDKENNLAKDDQLREENQKQSQRLSTKRQQTRQAQESRPTLLGYDMHDNYELSLTEPYETLQASTPSIEAAWENYQHNLARAMLRYMAIWLKNLKMVNTAISPKSDYLAQTLDFQYIINRW
eukprot:5059047-Amphidinium_carterae.1